MCPYAQDSPSLGLDSENRDAPHNGEESESVPKEKRRSAKAAALDELLDSERPVARDLVARLLHSINRDTARGPNRIHPETAPYPPAAARAHAATLAQTSAAIIAEATGAEANPREGAPGIGLPLLGAFLPTDLDTVTRILVARDYPQFETHQETLRVEASHYLRLEDFLWKLAASHGGPSSTLPYTYRFAATEWLVTPSVNRHRDASTICLRCGLVYSPTRESHSGRCDKCIQEKTREWPQHAIAPDGRGTWWIRCPSQTENCLGAFSGPAQKRWCNACRTAKITRSKRGRKDLGGIRDR